LQFVRFPLQFADMESIAASVRKVLSSLSDRAFVHARRVPGPTGAVEAELSRLARRGEIRRVRKGLYWKGPKTRLGIAAPAPQDVALEVAGPDGLDLPRRSRVDRKSLFLVAFRHRLLVCGSARARRAGGSSALPPSRSR
jgi:hypothetical protein